MYHHIEALEKDEIQKLIGFVGDNSVDLDTLRKEGINSLSHIGHLYLIDNIYVKELSGFWRISRQAVTKKLRERIKGKSWLYKLTYKKKIIELCPKDIFLDIEEYINFLEWRSEVRKDKIECISVKDAARILGTTEQTIYNYIKSRKIECYLGDKNKILKSSFILFLYNYINETRTRLGMLQKYINGNNDGDIKECTDKK